MVKGVLDFAALFYSGVETSFAMFVVCDVGSNHYGRLYMSTRG